MSHYTLKDKRQKTKDKRQKTKDSFEGEERKNTAPSCSGMSFSSQVKEQRRKRP